MQYFYDGQVRRYLAQTIRMLSNFKYRTADGVEKIVPVTYGDISRQVAAILKDNSENKMPSAPRIALYMTELELDRKRLSDATFTSKVHIRERDVLEDGSSSSGTYGTAQGLNYTVERLMPTPYKLTMKADIWSTNTDQKLQILEQILVLFNPSLEIQTTDNYVDWTSLSVVELTGVTLTSRSIPQGIDSEIDVATLEFETPIWITPPAKVTRMGVIHTIIANIFTEATGSIDPDFLYGLPESTQYITPGRFGLLVINNQARLIGPGESVSEDDIPQKYGENINWYKLLDQYGKFRAGISRLFLKKADGTEVVGTMSIHPSDDTIAVVNFDPDTYPTNTIIDGRGNVDAIIDPLTYNPPDTIASGIRYLLLDRIGADENNDGPAAWKNADLSDFVTDANNIIEWDGSQWNVIFEAASVTDVIYITNLRTGVQYKWDGEMWTKSFEGEYIEGHWRLVL
jgi:hypothetical protein